MAEKLPPFDSDAEEAVNGSLLIDGSCFKDISGILEAGDFLSAPNKSIFAAACALFERGVTIDIITVKQELDMSGVLAKVGGVAYLNSLMAATPTSLDARYYAEIVKRLSVFRQLITV